MASPVSTEFILKKDRLYLLQTINPWGVSFHSLHMFSNLKKPQAAGCWLSLNGTLPTPSSVDDKPRPYVRKRIIEIEPSVGEIVIPVFCNSLEEVYKELKKPFFR